MVNWTKNIFRKAGKWLKNRHVPCMRGGGLQVAGRNPKKTGRDGPKIKTYKDGHVIADYSGMDMPGCVSDTQHWEREHRKLERQMKRSIERLYSINTKYTSVVNRPPSSK